VDLSPDAQQEPDERRLDVRCGGADGRSRVTYDLPSSIFGYIGNPKLTEAARALDAKLTAFVEKITGAPVSD
jgi:hypothetical protein